MANSTDPSQGAYERNVVKLREADHLALTVELVAVWLFALKYPGRIRGDDELTAALGQAAFRVGKCTPKSGWKGRQRIELGECLRHGLGPFLIRAANYIAQATGTLASMKYAMTMPFTETPTTPSSTNTPAE